MPRLARSEVDVQRRAQCLQCEAAMDNPKTSRREFCAHAISLVTVASLIEGCGSKGNPGEPWRGGCYQCAGASYGQRNLRRWHGDRQQRGRHRIGQRRKRRARAGGQQQFSRRAHGRECIQRISAICTHEQCIVTGFQSDVFVCPCSRVAVQYQRAGSAGACDAAAPAIHHAIYE